MSHAGRAHALVLAVLLSPSLALAAWQPGGNRIGDGEGFVATASNGRVVVAWHRKATSDRYEVRLQAWTADGDIAAGWPAAGVLVGDRPGANLWPAICEDGSGGAFVLWVNELGPDRSFYLQHVSATGSPSPGWAPEGLRLGPASVYSGLPVAAHDGAGGVLVGWSEYYYDGRAHTSVRILRIDAGGVPAAGWPMEGHVIPDSYEVGLAVDGEQHVFVSTGEYSAQGGAGRLRVRRLGADAAPDPGWPQTGALLTDAVAPIQMKLFPDGGGGVFTGWMEAVICVGFCPVGPGASATRILGDGTRDEGWIPAFRAYSAAPDETGGMLLGLVSGGRPAVVRLDAAGGPMPGWAPGGTAAMTEIVAPHDVTVAGDGEGGAFVTWSDWRTGEYQIYASRLDAAGRLADGWPTTGSFVDADRGGFLYGHSLVSLGGGVAISLWNEWTPDGLVGYLTALRPGEPGPIAGLGPVPVEVGFGVTQVRPNPARGPIVAIVELPNEGPARIDLVDAAGRVLESQDFSFQWQALGAVHFNQSRALAPGVYWLRVTQGLRRAAKKVVVLE
ncbi:MAG: T9SS type A sorting domain-containing protein [Candidatus Eiseniibacteriota bacterium]